MFDVIIAKLSQKVSNLYNIGKLKTETIITLVRKFFLPEEFLSKDFKACETCT